MGVTNNLKRRMQEHKTKLNKGFTEKYNVFKLVSCLRSERHGNSCWIGNDGFLPSQE